MLFWAVAGLLGLGVCAALARALLRGGGAAAGDPALDVYKDQLSEVDRDLARGLFSPSEAAALRAEVSRRLLAAADASPAEGHPAPAGATRAMAVGVALAVLAGGGGIYAWIGNPGLDDQPLAKRIADNQSRYAERPTQAEVAALLAENAPPPPAIDPEQLALLDQLRSVLANRPDDSRGRRLLADNLGSLGLWADAATAQADLIRVLGDDATATDLATHAEYLILAVNGYVSPEAGTAITAALQADPQNPRARYFSGLSALQAGRADLAYDLWLRLLQQSRPDAPWVPPIRAQIADVALAAGRPVPELPPLPGASGPSEADMAAAAEMAPEDRAAMIRNMVAGLSDRLATEGGPAEDWARLIRAYGVLGERALASRIWTEAQSVFADAPADLSIIRQAARDAEVAQ